MKQTFNFCIVYTDIMTCESRIIAKFEKVGDAAVCAKALNKGVNEREIFTVRNCKEKDK